MKLQRMMLAATAVVALLFLLTMGAPIASADIYYLTSDHCDGTGGCLGASTSAGTITVTDISGGVTIYVVLTSGFLFNSGGFQADFGFNLAGDPTIGGSSSPADYTLVSTTSGALHMDGTGDFGYGFLGDFPNGKHGAKTGPYTFTVTGSGVTSSSFVQNAVDGQFFALDVYSSSTTNTGAVDASTKVVPDGGMTLMLLGGALVGLETLRRRIRA